MITFTKIKFEDIPNTIARRILNWSDKEIQIDDTGLTAGQISKITDFLNQEGYKIV